ncbi:MAG: ABC transporter substrate-binding protein [Chloroflexi bacterium]|nr:ABC transporter substrate-binding protein [Chloroflexota bacterium]MBV9894405.1 ABC transporter substrate-binding protein [Chloroflexota bacterium]
MNISQCLTKSHLGRAISVGTALLLLAGSTAPAVAQGTGQASGTPIVMSELFPMSGREAFVGDWLNHGAKVGVWDVNNNGGVMGHPIQEALADTGGDPVDAVTAQRQLMTQNPTFQVGPSSLEIQGVIQDFDPAHLVDFMEGGTSQVDHMQNHYVFRTTPSDSTLTAAMAYFALQQGWKSAVMLFETTSDATDELNHTTAYFTSNGGTILDTEQLALHQSSYRSEITKAFANGTPDVVFVKTDPQTGATLFANMRELGYLNLPIVSDDTGDTVDYAQAMGTEDAAKYLYGVAGSPATGPAWEHYVAGYQAVWNSDKPVQLSQNTYDAVVIGALAMTEAQTLDPTVWVDHITTVSNAPGTMCYTYADCVQLLGQGQKINYEGASGPQDFDQYHNTYGDWDIVQWNSDASATNLIMHVGADAIQQISASANP